MGEKELRLEIELSSTPDGTPQISVEIIGSTEKYFEWNIERAARTIAANPQEYKIASMVYNIHRDILANRGISEEKLKEGDDQLVARIEKYAAIKKEAKNN